MVIKIEKINYKQAKKDFKAKQKVAKKDYKSDRPPFKERAKKFGKKLASPFVSAKNGIGKFIHTRQQYNELKKDFDFVINILNEMAAYDTPNNSPVKNKLEKIFKYLNRHT